MGLPERQALEWCRVFNPPSTVTGGGVPGLCPYVFLHSEDVAEEEDWGRGV